MIEKLASRILIISTVTNACNQACKHCVTGASQSTAEELRYEVLEKLFEDLRQMNQDFMIGFVGGEATIWTEFFPMIEREEFKKIPYKMLYTNATAIGLKDIDKIKRADFYEVRVSIDSDREEEHDDLRGEGTFNQTINMVREMIRQEIPVTAATVMKKNNIVRLDQIVNYLKELGIRLVHFLPYYMSGRGALQKVYAVDEKDKAMIHEKVATKYKKFRKDKESVCIDGTAYFKIDCSGNCIIQWEREKHLLGNLYEDSFVKLYEKALTDLKPEIVNCKSCKYYENPELCENMHIYCMDDIDFQREAK